MPHELVLIFDAARMQELMDQSPNKIAVRSTIEEATLEGGAKAGVVKVYADAVQGGTVVATIEGCPVPPCNKD